MKFDYIMFGAKAYTIKYHHQNNVMNRDLKFTFQIQYLVLLKKKVSQIYGWFHIHTHMRPPSRPAMYSVGRYTELCFLVSQR